MNEPTEWDYLSDDLQTEIIRLRRVEELAAEMQATNEANRQLALDYKQMKQELDSCCDLDDELLWIEINGKHYDLTLANLLDRLTREP